MDPTLRQFKFCPVAKDRQLFRQQAINCIRLFVRPTNQLLNSSKVSEDNESIEHSFSMGHASIDDAVASATSSRAVTEDTTSAATTDTGLQLHAANPRSKSRTEVANPMPQKIPRLDIFARFRAGAESDEHNSGQSDQSALQNLSEEEISCLLDQDLRRYEDLRGPFVTNRHLSGKTEQAKSGIPDTSKVFNPLVWWGEEKYRFPYLSVAAKQILVIQGSSAESERHFSTAGKITRKDRARLHSSTVEAQVLLAEGIKKRLI